MKTWDAFFPDVLPAVPGTAEPVIEHQLRRAAQDFFKRTRAWSVALAPVQTAAGTSEYALALPAASELVRLESATWNAQDLPLWRSGDNTRGRALYTPDNKAVAFTVAPGGVGPLVVTTSLKPSNSAEGVEDSLFDQYVEQIAACAIAKLTGDLVKQATYEAECNSILTRLWRGNAAIRPRALPNYF